MTLLLISLVAILASGAAILALTLTDAKRRRAMKLGPVNRPLPRGWFAAIALLPGVALLLTGEGAAFLIWLGAAGVIGWLMVEGLAGGDPGGRKAGRSA